LKRLTAKRRALILANLDLAQKEANRAKPLQYAAHEGELLASAYFGLCKAVMNDYPAGEFRPAARIACRRQIIIDQEKLHRGHIGKVPLVNYSRPHQHVAPYADPLEQLSAAEESIRLWRALGALLPRQRQVIVAITNGQSGKQIAAELGIDHSTVSAHLRRGLSRLRAAMGLPVEGCD
jgi:RNA polymerase sigma factor (sigma-70 family)